MAIRGSGIAPQGTPQGQGRTNHNWTTVWIELEGCTAVTIFLVLYSQHSWEALAKSHRSRRLAALIALGGVDKASVLYSWGTAKGRYWAARRFQTLSVAF